VGGGLLPRAAVVLGGRSFGGVPFFYAQSQRSCSCQQQKRKQEDKKTRRQEDKKTRRQEDKKTGDKKTGDAV
jgi:hypothetical protein